MSARDENGQCHLPVNAVLAILAAAGRPPTRPTSSAERWAMYVFRACSAAGDLKTLEAWAECVGVSYSSLRESCCILDIRPHDARDLTRVLRAIIRSTVDDCSPWVLLDVSDSRTLRNLLDRSGIGARVRAGEVSVEEFLTAQRFVPNRNAGLRVLRELLLSAAYASSDGPPELSEDLESAAAKAHALIAPLRR